MASLTDYKRWFFFLEMTSHLVHLFFLLTHVRQAGSGRKSLLLSGKSLLPVSRNNIH